MAYPASIDTIPTYAGTALMSDIDHAGALHGTASAILLSIQNVLGTNSGTSVLKNFTAGDFAAKTSDLTGMVTTGGTQTLTNKTLTSPKINEDVALTSTATELNLLHGKASVIAYADARFKIGSFDYDTATATGTQAITGLGFTPKLVKFKLGVIVTGGLAKFSDGVSDGSINKCVFAPGYTVSTPGTFQSDASNCIISMLNSDYASATCTLGADGFTLSWVKHGSPTGTVTIIYEAYR